MIYLNNNSYKLVLLDTNALSNFLKDTKKWFEYFHKKYGFDKIILGCSIFSLSELYEAKPLFDKYLEIFSIFPSVIFDGYDSLFRKEIKNYYNGREEISPIVIAPFAIFDNNIKSDDWKKKRERILNGILALRSNFPTRNNKYTKAEVEDFVNLATIQQIILRDPKFSEELVNKKRKQININKFPSVLSTSYVVFYKFYSDNTKPMLSDVFDIIISSLLPYVDIVITEKHLCEVIRKAKSFHGFFHNLEYYSLGELKNEINDASK